MTKAGDVIENPVTGERIVFLETAADTGGERLKIDLHLEPTAFNASTHRHTKQRERIAIAEGELRIVVGRDEAKTLKAGEEVRLTGFGVFVVATRAGGKGRNPQTGEEITIKPSRQPRLLMKLL